VYARIGGTRDRASSRRAVHAHWGTLDGLRDKRGRGHLDFAACDVGRGAARFPTSRQWHECRSETVEIKGRAPKNYPPNSDEARGRRRQAGASPVSRRTAGFRLINVSTLSCMQIFLPLPGPGLAATPVFMNNPG
jgi:hypothetical protein